jgi:hypothetical protein
LRTIIDAERRWWLGSRIKNAQQPGAIAEE